MKNKTSLVFTGDIGFDRYMYKKWEDDELISGEILEFLHSADHVIANVEGPVAPVEQNTTKDGVQQLLHTIDPAAVKVLNNMHADIWNICNNHIMDAKEYGISKTLEIAKENNVQTIGAGMNIDEARKPVILDEAGGIGMFGVGYQRACRKADVDKPGCYSWSDLDAIQETIDEIKAKCRWCVVVAHAGEEFTPLPSPYTRERYHKYLEMGADIVVSHHPHVPMNYETVGDKLIFYSLGNFIFDTDYQRSQFNTELGLLVKLNFTEDEFTWEPMGLEIERGPEHIIKSELPRIFVDIQEDEYKRLAPLSAKVLVAATKRQMTYLNPARFKDATEEEWTEHFREPLRTGRVPGETLDFYIICPLAEEADKGEWKKSKLEEVKKYMLEHFGEI
ncbi:MAG: CapA family protein [Acutalibacteraceae bacterium]|nr:CapA family protein [Acutalibacteraceae bacterium]